MMNTTSAIPIVAEYFPLDGRYIILMATLTWSAKHPFHHRFPFPTMRFATGENLARNVMSNLMRYGLREIVFLILNKQSPVHMESVFPVSFTVSASHYAFQVIENRYHGKSSFENIFGNAKTFQNLVIYFVSE
jgi:hypothetical protein